MRRARVYRRFGDRVRELREEHGLSQERLGERTSTSLAYVGMIERGETNPSLMKITNIARVFDLSLSELFEGVEY